MDRRTALRALVSGAIALPLSGASGCEKPPPITPAGKRSFEHPETEQDLVRLVQRARGLGGQLRVRGALHSVGGAIFTDDDSRNTNVQLDRYNRILAFDDAKKQVTVQAGIHLGVDPLDPSSTRDNSLLYQLERKGWALPDLGGITHQTVGGFLSTGSAGGTVHHDVGESIVCMRIVAGDGQVYELRPGEPSDDNDRRRNPFYAAGVSMGLLGIISTVTFQCVDRYNIIGKQVTKSYRLAPDDALTDFGGLRRWMEHPDNLYNRVLIWPQKKVKKLQLWGARRTNAADSGTTHVGGLFASKPLGALSKLEELVVYGIYKHVGRSAPPYTPDTVEAMTAAINVFIENGAEPFWDKWLEALPMDNVVSDNYLPTEFTELFVDIEKTADVMRRLTDFWARDDRMAQTGPYATEVYPSKASRFWMSPSYGRNSFRVDVFWFKTGRTDPDKAFYPQYWELLRDFDFRFHWGKHLSAPDSSTGVAYRNKQSPMFAEFLQWRERFDPEQIFVTDYWRRHLGIGRTA